MAVYCRMDDLWSPAGSLPVHQDQLGPNARYRVWEAFTFTFLSLCTTVVHNTAQNSSDNFASYPPDKHVSSDDAYWREWGTATGMTDLMLRVPSNVQKNTGPHVFDMLSYLVVVTRHAPADLSQVDSQHFVDEIFHRLKVYDVRPLVVVSKQQPVTNCILVQVIVWIRNF